MLNVKWICFLHITYLEKVRQKVLKVTDVTEMLQLITIDYVLGYRLRGFFVSLCLRGKVKSSKFRPQRHQDTKFRKAKNKPDPTP
jgi:hypothetical protein